MRSKLARMRDQIPTRVRARWPVYAGAGAIVGATALSVRAAWALKPPPRTDPANWKKLGVPPQDWSIMPIAMREALIAQNGRYEERWNGRDIPVMFPADLDRVVAVWTKIFKQYETNPTWIQQVIAKPSGPMPEGAVWSSLHQSLVLPFLANLERLRQRIHGRFGWEVLGKADAETVIVTAGGGFWRQTVTRPIPFNVFPTNPMALAPLLYTEVRDFWIYVDQAVFALAARMAYQPAGWGYFLDAFGDEARVLGATMQDYLSRVAAGGGRAATNLAAGLTMGVVKGVFSGLVTNPLFFIALGLFGWYWWRGRRP
jgi:hypothetical protein